MDGELRGLVVQHGVDRHDARVPGGGQHGAEHVPGWGQHGAGRVPDEERCGAHYGEYLLAC